MLAKIKLQKREKIAVYVVGAIILVIFCNEVLISPFINSRKNLRKEIFTKELILQKMIKMKDDYEIIKKKTAISKQRFSKRENGFTLFSFLDKLAGQTGIKKNISYMKPSTTASKNSKYKLSSVEMKLKDINLRQLTAYLYNIETSKNLVNVKRLSITKTGKQKDMISAVLQVTTVNK